MTTKLTPVQQSIKTLMGRGRSGFVRETLTSEFAHVFGIETCEGCRDEIEAANALSVQACNVDLEAAGLKRYDERISDGYLWADEVGGDGCVYCQDCYNDHTRENPDDVGMVSRAVGEENVCHPVTRDEVVTTMMAHLMRVTELLLSRCGPLLGPYDIKAAQACMDRAKDAHTALTAMGYPVQ